MVVVMAFCLQIYHQANGVLETRSHFGEGASIITDKPEQNTSSSPSDEASNITSNKTENKTSSSHSAETEQNKNSDLFNSFLLWLQVIIAITFGFIAYLQWRDSQRHAKQQEHFSNYVESSTDFMSNSASLIDSMDKFMKFDTQTREKVATFEKTTKDKEEKIQEAKERLNLWANEFFKHRHRHEQDLSEALRSAFPSKESERLRLSLDLNQLNYEYQLIAGQYLKKLKQKLT